MALTVPFTFGSQLVTAPVVAENENALWRAKVAVPFLTELIVPTAYIVFPHCAIWWTFCPPTPGSRYGVKLAGVVDTERVAPCADAAVETNTAAAPMAPAIRTKGVRARVNGFSSMPRHGELTVRAMFGASPQSQG